MKHISDSRPERYIKSGGMTQVNYNIVGVTAETMSGGKRTSYEYEVVNIEGEFTRDKVISALLLIDYTIDDQIALLANNEMNTHSSEEFTTFQNRRDEIKLIVNKISF